MRRVQAVRSTFDEHQLAPLDRFVRALSARFERDDRVGVAVDDRRQECRSRIRSKAETTIRTPDGRK